MKPAPHCYTLPPDVAFLHSLAGWLLGEFGQDQSQFTKILVLLPNRRSCRALREAFLDITGGKPLLLPRIQPIGDIEGEGIFLRAPLELPQPIAPVRRHFLLIRLVMRFQQARGSGLMVEQAAQLASQLADFMDEVAREGLDFSTLHTLVPEELANHWQQTLDFLHIISHEWPRLLEEEGLSDIVAHRNQTLAHIAGEWKKNPPDFPVIAAGSTGSQPATALLLKTIAQLPRGNVILPGLDTQMTEHEWKQLNDTHPQHGLKQLLEHIGIPRGQVKPLTDTTPTGRHHWLRIIFAPPEATSQWATAPLPNPAGLSHIKLLEAETSLDEARMIAVALRKTLETPQKTAALVTPDRTLARMVAAQMQRLGVEIDDSAGSPLALSAPACFLRLVIEMVASRGAPAAILAALRHPLAGAGRTTAHCRQLSRELELALLRGIRRESGFASLRDAAPSPTLKAFLGELHERSAALGELFQPHYKAGFKQLLSEHLAFAQWLASTDEQSGTSRLWAGEAGNALADYMAQLHMQAELLPPLDPLTYPGLLDVLLSSQTYRPQYGLHPRLHIVSPMEARLQQYDVVILGGMNEGTWPQAAEADPWMSRPMRAAFGLPAPERAIGRSAHDVMMLCAAPEVLITRALKTDGAPSVASRWWVRIKTLVGGRAPALFASLQAGDYYLQAKEQLEIPAPLAPLAAPQPRPPLAARPRALRVTAIDQWLRDPYVIYARYILGLKKLDAIDREPDAADFGTIVHAALEHFTRSHPHALPSNPYEVLLACGRAAFAPFLDRPAVAALWWPRFETMAAWLVEVEKGRRASLRYVHSEIKATWEHTVDGKPFTLTTRIDRLEEGESGNHIIDYKTGMVPSKKDMERGLANQLPLEALIVENGSLSQNLGARSVSHMEYWKLSGEEVKCNATQVDIDKEQTRERLETLIRAFDDPHTAYAAQTDPSLALRFNDYAHLTRRKEWEAI